MFWVSPALGFESVFLGRQDFGSSVCEQVLVSLELLLLLLQASCSGDKPALEALLLYGILWYAEFVITRLTLSSEGGI